MKKREKKVAVRGSVRGGEREREDRGDGGGWKERENTAVNVDQVKNKWFLSKEIPAVIYLLFQFS